MVRIASYGAVWRLASFVSVTVLLWALAPGALAGHTAWLDGPPNIIVILTDDQGIDAIEGDHWPNDLGCHTPNLATLARQGRVFSNARVNPACSPTRAGLLTGRYALHTGVTGVLRSDKLPDAPLVSLQTYEKTIAEVLQEAGYATVLVDKWHVGASREDGQKPPHQGFDAYFPTHDYLYLDDPLETGDEHITRMVDVTVEHVQALQQEPEPYALFFWTIEPHRRRDRSGQEDMPWWKVDESLLPSGENYYAPWRDTPRNRYRAVVEAMDTELGRMLFELGVINRFGEYKPESRTVVFFLGDNGTPQLASLYPEHAKTTLYEGGVRVPFFVFGERVPLGGEASSRLVSHVDLYDTIADIASVAMDDRGTRLRQGHSFADVIGWSREALPEPKYQLLSRGQPDLDGQRVALTNGEYKLIAPAGGRDWADPSEHEFYDLLRDPREEINLLDGNMNGREKANYHRMREVLPDYWNTAVASPGPYHIDLPMTHALSMNDENNRFTDQLRIGHLVASGNRSVESRAWLRFDIKAIDELLPPDVTVDDIVGAQIILAFKFESSLKSETDTGVIRAFPAVADWHERDRDWESLAGAYRGDYLVGTFDPAPHIILRPRYGLSGLPMPRGTPVSLGHRQIFPDMVRYWYENPDTNRGVILMARRHGRLAGDQSVSFMDRAVLRLTFESP